MADSPKTPETDDLAAMLHRATQWVSSAHGRKVLTEAARESEEVTQQLERERRIDPKTLLEPVTL